MRNCMIVMAFLMPLAAQAQRVAPSSLASSSIASYAAPARQIPTTYIASAATSSPREITTPRLVTSDRYRIVRGLAGDRSAHTRALDEMNAINLRRPRAFRFKPVMALTFDAADMDGAPRMSGVAPDLMGMQPNR